ncbi:hypothetical protein [Pedobacter sp. L105]|uniref:hypothetical protein n=1 Tax=Pedobacter sp. L105 TaxID=1641871 RepID=UPI00131D58BF|nr:hypothetical protein [Pedobacter sp. L105]
MERGLKLLKIKKKKLDRTKKISTFAVPTKTGKQNATDGCQLSETNKIETME